MFWQSQDSILKCALILQTISRWAYPPLSFNNRSRLCYSVESTVWSFKVHHCLLYILISIVTKAPSLRMAPRCSQSKNMSISLNISPWFLPSTFILPSKYLLELHHPSSLVLTYHWISSPWTIPIMASVLNFLWKPASTLSSSNPPPHCCQCVLSLPPTPNILFPFRMSQFHLPLLPPTLEAVLQIWWA